MASYKKNAYRLGAHIVFVDESGFLMIPPVRKTWAPVGKTPILRHRLSHERISAICGICISPKRRHLGLYFKLHDDNIRQVEVVGFVRHLLRHIRKSVIIVWDNARIHKGRLICQLHSRFARLYLEQLPPYAPELNPAEGVFSQVKNSMANALFDDTYDLWVDLLEEFITLSSSQTNLKACVYKSDLPTFLLNL